MFRVERAAAIKLREMLRQEYSFPPVLGIVEAVVPGRGNCLTVAIYDESGLRASNMPLTRFFADKFEFVVVANELLVDRLVDMRLDWNGGKFIFH